MMTTIIEYFIWWFVEGKLMWVNGSLSFSIQYYTEMSKPAHLSGGVAQPGMKNYLLVLWMWLFSTAWSDIVIPVLDFYWCSFCIGLCEKHFENCDNDNDYRPTDLFFVFFRIFLMYLSYLQNTACLLISELGFKEGDSFPNTFTSEYNFKKDPRCSLLGFLG